MTALLDVQNLNVGFRQDGVVTPAVRGVSFTVNRGEVVALVGESGSGKSVSALSTLSLLGDSAQVSGSVKYDGQELIGAGEQRLRQVRGNDISFIFQEPMSSLNPLHTIEKQLTESLRCIKGSLGRRPVVACWSCWKRLAFVTRKHGYPAMRTNCQAGNASV